MEGKKSQENAIEAIETVINVNDKEITVESVKQTAVDDGPTSETEIDILSRTKQHRESIKEIIVSQYIDDQNVNDNNYAVTFSSNDKSILVWKINIEENGQQQPDVVYFKFDFFSSSFVLYKKTLIVNYVTREDCKYLIRK